MTPPLTPIANFPGMTDTILPIDDAPDTPYLSHMEVPIDSDYLDSMAYQAADPLEQLEKQEEQGLTIREQLLDSLDLWDRVEESLTSKQFQIFELYYLKDMTQEQIADILQLQGGQAVVSQMLNICRARLLRRLGPLLEPILKLRI